MRACVLLLLPARAGLSAAWPGSFLVQSQDGTPVSESYYQVGGPVGDVIDFLLPPAGFTNVTPAFLTAAYRVVVVRLCACAPVPTGPLLKSLVCSFA
jgi:hypothetical protein